MCFKRSNLEREKIRTVESFRKFYTIHAGYINSSPLSVDTKDDLNEVRKLMEKNE